MLQAPDGEPSTSARPFVLLVDDEKEFVDTLSKRLLSREYQVAVAYDGEEALATAARGGCEVMILDLKMPGIDGIEVLQRVKELGLALEVIILTGHGDADEEQAARTLGAFEYLRKPADIDELVEAMQRAYARLRAP